METKTQAIAISDNFAPHEDYPSPSKPKTTKKKMALGRYQALADNSAPNIALSARIPRKQNKLDRSELSMPTEMPYVMPQASELTLPTINNLNNRNSSVSINDQEHLLTLMQSKLKQIRPRPGYTPTKSDMEMLRAMQLANNRSRAETDRSIRPGQLAKFPSVSSIQ